MRKVKDEQGYILLVTLAVIIIFSIVGVSLMLLTMSGTSKSTLREDHTQATRLATKGEELLITTVQAEIEQQIAEGVAPDVYLQIFDDTLMKYTCKANVAPLKGETGEFASCIHRVTPYQIESPINPNDRQYNASNPYDPYRKYIEVASRGDVDTAVQKNIKTTYVMGKDIHLEYADFAIASRNPNHHASEGNIVLNGQIELHGNVYAANKLRTSNQANYYTKFIPSNYPTVQTNKRLAGEIPMIMTDQPISSFSSTVAPLKRPISYTPSEINIEEKVANFAQTFEPLCSSTVQDDCLKQTLISEIGGWTASALRAQHLDAIDTTWIVPKQNHHDDIVLVGRTCLEHVKFSHNIKILYEELTTKVVKPDSCAYKQGIRTADKNDDILMATKGMYVDGNLFIGHRITNDDSPEKPTIQVAGNFYVENDLFFVNTKLDTVFYEGTDRQNILKEATANFYVKGDVYIMWALFRESNINIYADGDIHFINVSDAAKVKSLNSDFFAAEDLKRLQPTNNECSTRLNVRYECYDDFADVNLKNQTSVLQGLVYSNETIQFHTASSAITFNGGVTAKNLHITGIGGHVFTGNAIEQSVPLRLNKYSLVRHVTNENAQLYEEIGNKHPENSIQLGVNYCIKDSFQLFSSTISSNTNKSCEKGYHYIVDERYRFPVPSVQAMYPSRVKFNQPKREELLLRTTINALDPITTTERTIQ